MKPFASKHSHTQNNLKEHTPVYDMAPYKQRQHLLKRQKLIKSLFDIIIFISIAGLSFSTLFLGV